jgi:hypothetical protein
MFKMYKIKKLYTFWFFGLFKLKKENRKTEKSKLKKTKWNSDENDGKGKNGLLLSAPIWASIQKNIAIHPKTGITRDSMSYTSDK